MTKRLTTEEWISRGRAKWGDRFDYSKVDYQGKSVRITIGCPEHGWIEVSPETHLMNRPSNTGCPKCGREKTTAARREQAITFDQFLQVAKELFGDKYTYDESSWKSIKHKIRYWCPKHGERSQLAESHIKRRESNTGCKLCGTEKRGDEIRMTFNEFLARAREVHGNKYNYSEYDFKSATDTVKVICKEHGPFYPVARDHLNAGTECPACKGLAKYTTEQWVELAKAVHGEKYGYEDVIYDGARKKVAITCPIHGQFMQVPANHVHNQAGCPDCGDLRKGSDGLARFDLDEEWCQSRCELYLVRVLDFWKIGISVDTRYRSKHYDETYFVREGNRVDCWCVEQKILHASSQYEPELIPLELQDLRGGKTELRDPGFMEIDQLIEVINIEMDTCEDVGWRQYVEDNLIPEHGYGWDED